MRPAAFPGMPQAKGVTSKEKPADMSAGFSVSGLRTAFCTVADH
jgi:hypothetical protein